MCKQHEYRMHHSYSCPPYVYDPVAALAHVGLWSMRECTPSFVPPPCTREDELCKWSMLTCLRSSDGNGLSGVRTSACWIGFGVTESRVPCARLSESKYELKIWSVTHRRRSKARTRISILNNTLNNTFMFRFNFFVPHRSFCLT